jgi:hypothetical protein
MFAFDLGTSSLFAVIPKKGDNSFPYGIQEWNTIMLIFLMLRIHCWVITAFMLIKYTRTIQSSCFVGW